MTSQSEHRTARVQRETSESSIDLSIDLDGTGTSDIETSRAVLRPPAHRVRQALAHRPHRAGAGRHRHRRAPHRRRHRHRARPGHQAGARRQARHLPLRRRPRAARRGARAGRRRHLRPSVSSCTRANRRASNTTSSAATSRVRWCGTSSRRSPSTRRSPCTSPCSAAATRTTSPRPSSRPSRAHSGRRRRSTRSSSGVPSTKGAL